MNNIPFESLDITNHLPPTDIGATNATGTWIDMGLGDVVTFCAYTCVGYGSTSAVVSVKEATDSSGTSSAAISGLTVTLDAASESGRLTIKAEDLTVTSSMRYVAVNIADAGNNGNEFAGAVAVKGKVRYKSSALSALTETDIS